MSAGEALEGVLSGLKVVEFAHVIAGPMAGTLLADLGATVVHVEAPQGGDTARTMGPAKDGVHLWWKVAARNKRSVRLDLRRDTGRDIAHRLIAWADVVITNLQVDTLEAWNLDWSTAREINPTIVYLQITGYGALSSKRAVPGFGKVGEARSGVVHLTGSPDGPPTHTGFSHADSVTGLAGAFAIVAALYRRAHDPEFRGEWIDVALFEPLFRLVDWQVIVYDQLGLVPARNGNRLAVAPAAVVNSYLSQDGAWITVTSATPRSVQNVARLLGLDQESFATREQQEAAADLLDRELAAWVSGRTAAEALQAMQAADVVASKVFDIAEIFQDPTYRELDDIIQVKDPELGAVRMPAVMPRMHINPGAVWRTGPSLGEDDDLVYRNWLHIDAEEFAALKRSGVI